MTSVVSFPFAALVGQREMRTALVLAVVNPQVGGVLLVGPRGTGKTTAARGLVDVMPPVQRSKCVWGCEPEMAYSGGVDAVCAECAQKIALGEPLVYTDRMRFIELPLSADLPDVVGRVNDLALEHGNLRLDPGILSTANRNLLYIDEVNLLESRVADAILDAAAQGRYTVRRGHMTGTYQARFVLVGSMNPEEGALRPQILDRFGLRVLLNPLHDAADRLELYRRVRAFQQDAHAFAHRFERETMLLALEIAEARERLPQVDISAEFERRGLELVQSLGIGSHRAEYALFEAARAHAAADGRMQVQPADLRAAARLALPLRRSPYMEKFGQQAAAELGEIDALLDAP